MPICHMLSNPSLVSATTAGPVQDIGKLTAQVDKAGSPDHIWERDHQFTPTHFRASAAHGASGIGFLVVVRLAHTVTYFRGELHPMAGLWSTLNGYVSVLIHHFISSIWLDRWSDVLLHHIKALCSEQQKERKYRCCYSDLC